MARTRRPAAAPAPVAPIAERVVEIIVKTPKVESTRVLDATMPHAWLVGCERARCTHKMLVAKYEYRPVDYSDPDGPAIRVELSAPGRRFCGLHMPI